jgi:hypothetical protein
VISLFEEKSEFSTKIVDYNKKYLSPNKTTYTFTIELDQGQTLQKLRSTLEYTLNEYIQKYVATTIEHFFDKRVRLVGGEFDGTEGYIQKDPTSTSTYNEERFLFVDEEEPFFIYKEDIIFIELAD